MQRRESKFTKIFWDLDPVSGKLLPYVRLCPTFLEMEELGRSHGFAIGGGFRESQEEAIKFADSIDQFLEAMCQEYQQENKS